MANRGAVDEQPSAWRGGAVGTVAATVAAPEAVDAAVTRHLAQLLHRDHNTRAGQPTAPSRAAPASPVATDTAQPAPVTGRTNTPGPKPRTSTAHPQDTLGPACPGGSRRSRQRADQRPTMSTDSGAYRMRPRSHNLNGAPRT
jgi:hypothetical protein